MKYSENYKKVNTFRKEQWEGLKVENFIDEGAEAFGKMFSKPFVLAEFILYPTFVKALVDTTIRKKKEKLDVPSL